MPESLCSLITPYKCKVCGQDMLFFETRRKTLIDYKRFLDNGYTLSDMKNSIAKDNIRFLRCIQCGRSFIIDWTHGWPEQLMDINAINKFRVQKK